MNAFGIPYTVACDLDPGNEDSAKTSKRILALVEEAELKHGPIATVEHFDPDIPSVCHGGPPPPGGEKPFNALVLIRDGKPTDAFAARVKSLFRI